MTIYLLDLYVIAAVCSVLAVLCGGAGLVCWITSAIDDRLMRRIDDCDGARLKDKWTKITSDSELFDHDLCPHCMDSAELCDCQAEVNETKEPAP